MTNTVQRKIAYQGERGANSHIACGAVFPDYEAIPCATFEDVFQLTEEGQVEKAMIPIENSVAGRVADIHHLLPSSNLNIVGEYFLPIRHQLLGVKGTTLQTLKTVQSHVMALGQCRTVLRQLGVRTVVGADTAGSARDISEAKDITRGAIASTLAAEIYGLEILKKDIEDAEHNTTRFIIMEKNGARASLTPEKKIKTSFVFKVRNIPAALYKALGGFATNGVNMTKLESYMLDGSFTVSQFYAEIMGHPDEKPVTLALEELQFFSSEFRLVGVYNSQHMGEDL